VRLMRRGLRCLRGLSIDQPYLPICWGLGGGRGGMGMRCLELTGLEVDEWMMDGWVNSVLGDIS
jgi:hypothetical protein